MPDLIAPTVRLHEAWLDARDDWGRGVYQDGAGLRPGDDVDSAAGFAAWVERLNGESDPARPVAAGWVHCTYRWIVEDDRVLGAIALRHELNEFLLRAGGHIGYGVRPSARRRGLATWALGRMLAEARALGLDRLLITCTDGNEASARTIERHGGVLEDVRGTEVGTVRRYWITLAG
jgi:predicted acetyltransferase